MLYKYIQGAGKTIKFEDEQCDHVYVCKQL